MRDKRWIILRRPASFALQVVLGAFAAVPVGLLLAVLIVAILKSVGLEP